MPSVKSMGRLLRWLWLLAAARVHGEDKVDGGDILDAMLGAPPPTPQIPTVAPVVPTTPEQIVSPNKPGCAADITTALYDLTNIARMLTYVTTDCAQPGQVSTVCANDVLTIVRYMAKTAAIISDAVFTCGNIQAGCSQTIANAIAELAHLADNVALMEITCDTEKLACALQVFGFLSSGLHCAKNIDTAIIQCPLDTADDGGDDGDDGSDGDGGSDGGDSGDGGDGNAASSSGATTTGAPEAPPDLTPAQVAQFYPNGVDGAPPVLGASPDRMLLGPSLRGKGGPPSLPTVAESPSILPLAAEGFE